MVRSIPGPFLGVAIALVVFASSLALLSHGGTGVSRAGPQELDTVQRVLLAWSALPLIAWRRFPFGVFAVTATASVLLAARGDALNLLLGPSVALYLFVAHRRREDLPIRPAAATILGLFVAYLSATAIAYGAVPDLELLHTGFAWSLAWLVGERTRLRRAQVADLKQRALDAERAVERERRLAIAEERARIARDLHDSAGHAINVIVLQAGAARLRYDQEPGRVLLALELIEDVARQTAAEVDQLVGRLREVGATSGATEHPIGLASLESLIAQHAEAGLIVRLTITGRQRPLGRAVDQAAFRILQEALTNAARHGEGQARVGLRFGEREIEITVTNPIPQGKTPAADSGHGLVGMRERARLFGGSLDAIRTDGMFRIHARLPDSDGGV